MTVRFTASPKPTEEWSVNETVVTESKRIVKTIDEESATLTIKKVHEENVGDYTLKLTNIHGDATIEMKLIVMREPSMPQGPMITKDIRSDRVTIEWKPPADTGGCDLTSYTVEKREKTTKTWTKVTNVETEVLSYCVDTLQEDVEYVFRVIANNEVGPSEPLDSDPVTAKSSIGTTTNGLIYFQTRIRQYWIYDGILLEFSRYCRQTRTTARTSRCVRNDKNFVHDKVAATGERWRYFNHRVHRREEGNNKKGLANGKSS